MPKVQRDELGLWIDHGQGAIRPSAPSRLKEGDMVDASHFGGSPLHGVGKMEGRGRYREAWLSAPEPKDLHESEEGIQRRTAAGGGAGDFASAWQSYARSLAALARGNPGRGPDPEEGVDVSALKRGRRAYMAANGYTMGLMAIEDELIAQGSDLAAAMAAMLEARDLRASAPAPDDGRGPKAKIRM